MFQQALKLIQEAQSLGIVSHVRPDGDALGSTLGLGLSLMQSGKDVFLYNEDGMNELYRFLPQSHLIKNELPEKHQERLWISLDCSTQERLGAGFNKHQPHVHVNIDHHVSNTQYAEVNVIDPSQPSTASMVLDFIQYAKFPLTLDVANNLYLGIATDTGSFRYRGTSAHTFRQAALLVEHGVDSADLSQKCFQSLSLPRFELMRKALYQVVFEKDHRLAHVHITSELLQSVGAKSEDTEGLIDKLQDVQTVELSVLFETLTPQTMKVSLRSKKRINVSQLASEFGGGGHPLASGIRMEGDPVLNKEKVLSRIRQLMDNL